MAIKYELWEDAFYGNEESDRRDPRSGQLWGAERTIIEIIFAYSIYTTPIAIRSHIKTRAVSAN